MHCRPGAGSGEAKDSRANREMVSNDVAQNTTDNPTRIMKDGVKSLRGRNMGYNLRGRGVWFYLLCKGIMEFNVGVTC